MDLAYELINNGTAYQVISNIIGYNIENLVVPDIYNGLPVIGVGGDAFLGNSILKTVMLGNNIQFLTTTAFAECTNLHTVTIGKNLNYLSYGVFQYSENLNKVYFQGNAPTFQSDIFFGTSPNLKLYRKKNFVTGWPSSVQGVPVVLWSDNVIKSGGTGKLIGKSFIKKIIINNAQDGGNGTYVRNNENDPFIGPFDPENNLYWKIQKYLDKWILDRDETYYGSYDLINWHGEAFFWGNGTAQVFYKI